MRVYLSLNGQLIAGIFYRIIYAGDAEWEDGKKGSKTQAIIYWRKPEDWANLILGWVSEMKRTII